MAGEESIRTFIAVEIPDEARDVISSVISELRGFCSGVRWVPPENLHLTLKFLGNLNPERLSALRSALGGALVGARAFGITLSGIGAFPDLRRPRVFWIGVGDGREDFEELYNRVEDALSGEGFPREGRRFSPHLTIGRVKSPKGLGGAASKIADITFPPQKFIVDEVVLMRSDLKPSGPIYTPLERYGLASRGTKA